jgi:hypothetical protein
VTNNQNEQKRSLAMITAITTCRGPGGRQPMADVCPFHNDADGHCRAAFSGLPVDRHSRNLRCSTEDYDGCPLFLARALRGSRPKARLEPWTFQDK